MSVTLPFVGEVADFPGLGWWLLLGTALAMLALAGPLPAVAALVWLLIVRRRPFDVITSMVVVVAGASFVDYTKGQLTFELSLFSIGLAFMLFCYLIESGRPRILFPRTTLTLPLGLYVGLSLANFIRGVLIGNSLRYAGLELLIVLAQGSSFLIANRMFRDRDLRHLERWLFVIGLGHVVLGFWIFSTVHVRIGSLSFTPIPGLFAALFFNLGLRAPSVRGRLAWMLATLPLVLHQFLSFTRGYWLAIAVAFAFSVVVYGGRGPRASKRWVRASGLVGVMVALMLVGGAILAVTMGISNLALEAQNRLASSVSTEFTYEAGSNVVRLVEYVQVLGHIARSPWIGHGLGYAFVIREPFQLGLKEQWATHDNYLLVWVKQGLLGLVLFVWTLVAAIVTGVRDRGHEDPRRVGWTMGTAAATLYVLVYCLVHFPLGEINTTYALALMWGVMMSLTSTGTMALRVRPPRRFARGSGAR